MGGKRNFVQEHQLIYFCKMDGQTEKLCEHTKYVETDLAENLFPRCRHYFPWGEVTILATAPITAKGERLSCLLYEVTVKNKGREAAEMTVCLPALYEKKYSDTRKCVDDNSGEWNVSGCFLYTAANGAETGFTSVWRSEPVSGYRNVFK